MGIKKKTSKKKQVILTMWHIKCSIQMIKFLLQLWFLSNDTHTLNLLLTGIRLRFIWIKKTPK